MVAPQPVTPGDFAATELLGGCPAEVLARLQACSRVRALRRQQVLFGQGDPVDGLVVVRSGRLKVYATSTSGDALLLSLANPGDTLGEVGLLDPVERSATVEAMEPSEVVLVPRDELLAAMDEDPALSRRLQARIGAITRRLTEFSTDLAFVDLPRRLAKALLALGADHTTAGALGLTQSELASLVGGSRQTVNTALAGFEKRGWLDLDSGRVVSINTAALRRFADG